MVNCKTQTACRNKENRFLVLKLLGVLYSNFIPAASCLVLLTIFGHVHLVNGVVGRESTVKDTELSL